MSWPIRLVLCSTILCISTIAQSPNLGELSKSEGLVNGKREMVCPHSSARALSSFVKSNSPQASKAAHLVYSGDSQKEWAYVKIGQESIPTLKSDGHTLDYAHPNRAGLLIYEKSDKSVRKTFWSHRFDNGETISSGDNLKSEGVDNFADIKAEVRKKKFCILQTENGPDVDDHKDLIWTNTIIMQDSDVPDSGDLSSFRKINEQFLLSLPAQRMQRLHSDEALFMTSAKTSAGDEILTYFDPVATSELGYLKGVAHIISRDTPHHNELINSVFKDRRKKSRVYVYGVDVKSLDLSKIAAQYDLELIHRGPTIIKDFLKTDLEIRALSGRRLDAKTTSVLNGIPSTEEELKAMDKPSSGREAWSRFKNTVENHLAGQFSNRIETREELFKELTDGSNDVVFLFAHFDGNSIFFGEEKVSLGELEQLQVTRVGNERPRLAVLLICNAGVLTTGQRTLFRRQLNSVGEVMIKKGFFEKVIAPDHEIESTESIGVLSEYLLNGKVKQKGWMILADLSYPRDLQ